MDGEQCEIACLFDDKSDEILPLLKEHNIELEKKPFKLKRFPIVTTRYLEDTYAIETTFGEVMEGCSYSRDSFGEITHTLVRSGDFGIDRKVIDNQVHKRSCPVTSQVLGYIEHPSENFIIIIVANVWHDFEYSPFNIFFDFIPTGIVEHF